MQPKKHNYFSVDIDTIFGVAEESIRRDIIWWKNQKAIWPLAIRSTIPSEQ